MSIQLRPGRLGASGAVCDGERSQRPLAFGHSESTYVGEALEALGRVDHLEAVGDALVHSGVGLHTRGQLSERLPACGT